MRMGSSVFWDGCGRSILESEAFPPLPRTKGRSNYIISIVSANSIFLKLIFCEDKKIDVTFGTSGTFFFAINSLKFGAGSSFTFVSPKYSPIVLGFVEKHVLLTCFSFLGPGHMGHPFCAVSRQLMLRLSTLNFCKIYMATWHQSDS